MKYVVFDIEFLQENETVDSKKEGKKHYTQ